MSDKARELLAAVFETEVGADFIEGEDSDYGVDALERRKVWQAIDAFLSDPIPAAREAALAEALKECQQLAIDRIRTVDEAVKKDVYAADALMGIATLSHRALSDTSLAAAALLAQGERLREEESDLRMVAAHLELLNEPGVSDYLVDALLIMRRVLRARAALDQGKEKE